MGFTVPWNVQAAGGGIDRFVLHYNGDLYSGEVFKPPGNGPFPAVLYNHGSARGMLNSQASSAIGPLFAQSGFVFFMPYRRGQGLSESTMTRLLQQGHFQDQMAALRWLQSQIYVSTGQVAVAGNSFGGVESLLGAETGSYCAAIDASGGAESWSRSPSLRALLTQTVRAAQSPVFFFQAANDFDTAPTVQLAAEMRSAGKSAEVKVYPAFGQSAREGHSFAYAGSDVWFADVLAFVKKHCLH